MRWFFASLAVLAAASLLCAQEQMNVQQLADFVRSELALHPGNDKQVANYIKKLHLTEKLTDKTILDLEAQGAGPKTVQALQELRDQTANLKPPTKDATYSPATAPDNSLTTGPATASLGAKAPPIPPPDSVTQQKILGMMKEYALQYTENLPNFICTEATRQYIDPNGGDAYRSLGFLLSRIGYHEGQEENRIYSINGKLQDMDMRNAKIHGGAVSTGEFGSMMRAIFEPSSQAEFGWDHWATLRGRRMAVFNYFIDSGHSEYSISYGSGEGDQQRIITAYSGLIYADPNTGEIDRIKFQARDIPKSFPVNKAEETLDYDQVDISGNPFILPLVATLYMVAGRENSKNEIQFGNYRKFEAGSTIFYGDSKVTMDPTPPPPLPASKTEERPASESKPTANPFGMPTVPPPPPGVKPPQ
ncbi:MAG TPA: hypothetical protein VFA65_14960 [Bryobacteraceae bacterium]|nr:hypothetical protein [Bryobacteraceae bacterium]